MVKPIRRSYYLGSSQGGREALIVVQPLPPRLRRRIRAGSRSCLYATRDRRSARARKNSERRWIDSARESRADRRGTAPPVRCARWHRGWLSKQLSRLLSQVRSGGCAQRVRRDPVSRRSGCRRKLSFRRADQGGQCGIRLRFLFLSARQRLEHILWLDYRK
jgi:hypothetical protein